MSQSDQFDVRDFRRALSQFPTGVTVITTLDGEKRPVGVTASSFNSVSIDPPLVLWSIDKGSNSLETYRTAEHFAVNVLSTEQVALSNRFASRGEDKFQGVEYSDGVGGSPLFPEYAAQFECKTWAVYEGGDHLILVGEVLEYRYADVNQPLVFARGSYAVSSVHPEMARTNDSEASSEFVSGYLLYLLRENYNRHSQALYKSLKEECGVSPEEWRVLAVLSGQVSVSTSDLAGLVMQPEDALLEQLSWMSERQQMLVLNGDRVSLTESGKAAAQRLLEIAKMHEQEVLSSFSDTQVEQLKSVLRSTLGM